MFAYSDDAPGIHNKDHVRMLDRRHALGDDDLRGFRNIAPEALANHGIGVRVNGGSRVIQDQHLRMLEQRTRNAKPLPLSAGNIGSSLLDMRVVSIRESRDEFVRTGKAAGFLQLLIRGIGRYAGLDVINVPGATGLADTNYEGKAAAAIAAFRSGYDFVYLHVEASDEAGHDGSIPLKLRTIEDLDHRLIQPILKAFYDFPASPSQPSPGSVSPSQPSPGSVLGGSSAEIPAEIPAEAPLCIALLPDHPTPCAHRTHTAEPIPFAIYHPGIEPDSVSTFDEDACRQGIYGELQGDEFIKHFLQ